MSELLEKVRCDIRANSAKGFLAVLYNPSVHACLWIRLAGLGGAPYYLARLVLVVFFASDIGKGAKIGKGLTIPHPLGIVIGAGVSIGDNCTIYHNVTLGQNRGEYPTIGSHSVIYPGAIVVGRVNIESGSVIKAGALVH